jgi:hypothetical protein
MTGSAARVAAAAFALAGLVDVGGHHGARHTQHPHPATGDGGRLLRQIASRDASGLGSHGRQPHPERGALAVGALDGEVAAHQPADVAADRETQPGVTG